MFSSLSSFPPATPRQHRSPLVGWHWFSSWSRITVSSQPPVLPPAKPCHGTDGVRTTNPVMHGIMGSWTCHPTRPIPVDCFPRRCLHYGHRPSLSVSSPCVYNFILSPGWCCVTISSPLIGAVGSGSFPPSGLQLQTAIDRI